MSIHRSHGLTGEKCFIAYTDDSPFYTVSEIRHNADGSVTLIRPETWLSRFDAFLDAHTRGDAEFSALLDLPARPKVSLVKGYAINQDEIDHGDAGSINFVSCTERENIPVKIRYGTASPVRVELRGNGARREWGFEFSAISEDTPPLTLHF